MSNDMTHTAVIRKLGRMQTNAERAIQAIQRGLDRAQVILGQTEDGKPKRRRKARPKQAEAPQSKVTRTSAPRLPQEEEVY